MSGIEKWSPTAASNNDAAPDGWPEGMAPSGVNDSARENMAAIRNWYNDAEWPVYGRNGHANSYSISYVSATVFKFASTDRRTLAPVGRRVKAGVGAGVIYGSITDSSLSASDTQVTVTWDSGQLDASLSYVALGVLSSSNNSFPRNMDMSFSDVTMVSLAGSVIATQANQESADAVTVVVTPGRQQYHPSAAKGWAKAASNGTIAASYNVSSGEDQGSGQVKINWATDFSGGEYVVVAMAQSDGALIATAHNSVAPAAGSVIINTFNTSGALTDATYYHVVAFGDQ